MSIWRLACEDCITAMGRLEDGSIGMVFTDPPFGVTNQKQSDWNNVGVDLDLMWQHFRRLVRPDGAICIMGVQPFTARVIASNFGEFKYTWIWRKNRVTNVLNAKKRPLNVHCEISVFARRGPTYRPQGLIDVYKVKKRRPGVESVNYGAIAATEHIQTKSNYPRTVLEFNSVANPVHPTEKPVDLIEYMIRTYSDEGEIVLDPYMGAGSTGVAALRAGRRFVGIDNQANWVQIARQRLRDVNELVG